MSEEIVGLIECRWSEANDSYEIVRWYDDGTMHACCVIAYVRERSDGHYIETVGDRFFCSTAAFTVAKDALKQLDRYVAERNGEDDEHLSGSN